MGRIEPARSHQGHCGRPREWLRVSPVAMISQQPTSGVRLTEVCVGTIAQPASIVQLCQVLQMSQLQQQPLCSKFCTQLQVPQACQLAQLLNPHPCLNLSHATQCVQPAQPL